MCRGRLTLRYTVADVVTAAQVVENHNTVLLVAGNAQTSMKELYVDNLFTADQMFARTGETINAGGLTVLTGDVSVLGLWPCCADTKRCRQSV